MILQSPWELERPINKMVSIFRFECSRQTEIYNQTGKKKKKKKIVSEGVYIRVDQREEMIRADW